jgi:1-acylglycerone phosphate reductase
MVPAELMLNIRSALLVPAVEAPLASVRNVMEIGYFGTINMCNAFLPLLMRAKGTIVNHGSILDRVPVPWNSANVAMKAAVFAYSCTLRLELEPLGVGVVYLRTASVLTNRVAQRPSIGSDSLYSSVSKQFEAMIDEIEVDGAKSEDAARGIVTGVLSKRRFIVREGKGAWVIWFMTWLDNLLPFDMLGTAMRKAYFVDQVMR